MGFSNIEYKNTINSLVDGLKERLNNPYYIHTDKSPLIVDYYNQNISKSTLDEAAKIAQSNLGEESPIRFNLIEDAVIYGVEKFIIDLDIGDFGLESTQNDYEAIILPKTWVPIENDYFIIKHAEKTYLFTVVAVNRNILDSGATMYKITYTFYSYDQAKIDAINSQVEQKYKMIIDNAGTQMKSIVMSTEYDFIEAMDNILSILKEMYKVIFYRDRVQTFVFKYADNYFYDPYMIEFLIRNNIMKGTKSFVYVSHQCHMYQTFPLDYRESFLHAIETCKKEKFKPTNAAGFEIQDPYSLMSTRLEPYYRLDYKVNSIYVEPLQIISNDLYQKILDNTHYEDLSGENTFYNIIIDYLNGVEISANYLEMIDNVELSNKKELFYAIPIIIYIIEKKVSNLLK